MSLTQLIKYIKKFGPLALLGVIIFFILFYSIRVALILNKNRQGENIVLNPVFGKLTKPEIPISTTSAGFKFQIDTIEGKPVTATKSANVYFLPPSSTKFGYRDRITSMASQLGIINIDSYSLQANLARFQESTRNFTVDITNYNFNFNYDYSKDPDLFTRSIIPTSEEVQKEAVEILKSIQRYPSEFDTGTTKINYFLFNAEKNTKDQVARNIDANLVEVNF